MSKTKRQPAKKNPVRIAQGIDKMGGLLTEQCRIYRAARRGEITPTAGYKLMQMLNSIRATIETGDLENRIRDLEKRMADRG